ncbi:MAG: ABC transporter ATP-binding protein/permease [Ruminococcus sp.]|jgi:ATP-binding cassette subfamily B protein|nr:ABC transporter ATP-binding protein/permease [Ruminococcus sp.]
MNTSNEKSVKSNTARPVENIRLGGHRSRSPQNIEKPKELRRTLKRLLKFLEKRTFFLLILVMVIVTGCSLITPSLQKSAIDSVSFSEETGFGVDLEQLGVMVMWLIVTYIMQALFTYFQGILSAKLSASTVLRLRKDLFNKIVRLTVSYTDNHSHGDIMFRMTGDVENISNAVSVSVGSLITGLLTIIGTNVIMVYYSPMLTLISVMSILLTVIISTKLNKVMRKYFVKQQELNGILSGHIEETVTAYKTVTAYNLHQNAEDKFNKTNAKIKRNGFRAQMLVGVMGPCLNFVSNFGFLSVAVFGAVFALNGSITVGTIQAFLMYSKQFSRPVNEIANQIAVIQTAAAGAERVFEILDAKNEDEIEDFNPNLELTVELTKGKLDFRDVRFSYIEGREVLKGFSASIKAGQKIAVVGATGSGKTTVINLLTRFYSPDSGVIEIDGIPIENYPKDELRKALGEVLQDTFLFSDTIGKNIRYGDFEADDEAVRAAINESACDRFIEALPGGEDFMLSEGGENLSAGQRQLLAIARVVLKNPKILILDEATSNVDTRTEMHITAAMQKLMKNRTTLIIAHRLSTIRGADNILVISGGRVVEQGNHDDLIRQGGEYFKLYKTQFEGRET